MTSPTYIQFVDRARRRRTISLVGIDKRTLAAIRGHVECLNTASITNRPPPRETAFWLADIGDSLYAKLVRAGLVLPRGAPPQTQLGAFLDAYIARRTDLKPRSTSKLKQVRRWLVKHFGETCDLRDVNRSNIGDWHRLMKSQLSPATASANVIKARQMFNDALDAKLIDANPLAKLRAGTQANPTRLQYVPVADVLKVIDQCPDAEWKLIFALARFAGLRIPSESSALKWSDVRWDENRMTVWSPKTEHHRGKESRTVPLFPELLPFLRDAYEAAGEGVSHCIVRLRQENLRTTAEKIIARAGLAKWPRLFQNLRSSCETDLTAQFPVHVACAWIGNSAAVAMRHYLQVTDAHFDQAVRAARGAAEDAGNDRKETEQTEEILRKIVELLESEQPREGSNLPANFCDILKISHRALQRALQNLKTCASNRSRSDVEILRRAVDAARTGRQA